MKAPSPSRTSSSDFTAAARLKKTNTSKLLSCPFCWRFASAFLRLRSRVSRVRGEASDLPGTGGGGSRERVCSSRLETRPRISPKSSKRGKMWKGAGAESPPLAPLDRGPRAPGSDSSLTRHFDKGELLFGEEGQRVSVWRTIETRSCRRCAAGVALPAPKQTTPARWCRPRT